MASGTALLAQSPLLTPYSGLVDGRSCSSFGSGLSTGTVQRNQFSRMSSGSLASFASYYMPATGQKAKSLRSISTFDLTRGSDATGSHRLSDSTSTSRRASLPTSLRQSLRTESAFSLQQPHSQLVNVVESEDELPPRRQQASALSFDTEDTSICTLSHSVVIQPNILSGEVNLGTPDEQETQESPKPFKRWLSTLRRKKKKKPRPVMPRTERWTMDDFEPSSVKSPPKSTHAHRFHHKKSASATSSLAFVTAVKSATVTLASASIAPLSRRTVNWRRGHQRSSIVSASDPRTSVESTRSVSDEATRQRSRRRREKIEELIRTEESYVADLKALSNAFFTLLAPNTSSAGCAKASAHKTLADILHLHDEILGDIYRVVPFAEYDQTTAKSRAPAPPPMHKRWHSVEAVPPRPSPLKIALAAVREGRRSLNISRSSDEDPVMLRCSPQTAAAVAQVFNAHMKRFLVYEEYGAKYEMMQQDIETVQKAINSWPEYDRAIETLSATLNPLRSREANRKKALTVKDLLIKPIQRITRYELLFSDLCKLTPSCDGPESQALLEDVLCRFAETCQGINQAKDNPQRMRILEISWILQDRLVFPGSVPRSTVFQLLGQLTLCGVLHIAYRSKDRIKGKYAICVLYQSCLLLVDGEKDITMYNVVAGIPLATATVEEVDNGKGLQCHTAPYSWKLVFEHTAQMYELILTACTAIEGDKWREMVTDRIAMETKVMTDGEADPPNLQSPLISDMRSIGKAFSKPGSFVRRMSVQRSATLGPSTSLNQVILKNTQAVKEFDNASNVSLPIPRSQSVLSPSHINTLVPRRADRARLEAFLVDVWTKDLLPYPGMGVRRTDNSIRASANHVMRKFSMASIASSLPGSKRTVSSTSISSAKIENAPPAKGKYSSKHQSEASKRRGLPLVDFHNAPDAFLPADFELQDPKEKRKKMGLRTLTMTAAFERPRSPFWGSDTRTTTLKRAQSVKNVWSEEQITTCEALNSENEGVRISSRVGYRAKTPVPMVERVSTPAPGGTDGAAKEKKSKGRLFGLFG